MADFATRLSKKLKELRGDQTLTAFARQVGVSSSTLHDLEGKRQNVTLKTLECMCKRLKCDIGDLFDA